MEHLTARRSFHQQEQVEDVQPSLASRLPELAVRAAWRHRWPLAPWELAAVTVASTVAGHGLVAAGVLGGVAVCLAIAAHTGVGGVSGRMWLSVRERRLAAAGVGGAGAWAGLVTLVPVMPWWVGAGLLGGVLSWPTRQWWASRRPTPPAPSPLSPLAQDLLAGWAQEISVGTGPRALRGSVPVQDSVLEPAEGTVVMQIQLARGVHAREAVTTSTRQAVEALNGLPEDTVQLRTLRDDSTRLEVLFTPSRHLERAGGVPWLGPVLTKDGAMPLAECADGSTVDIPLFDDSGVQHGFISGTTGVGKSVTTAAVMLPGVIAGLEALFYLDGKRGTSLPAHIDPALTRMATTPKQWKAMIEMVYAIMIDRAERRGKARQTKWRTGHEADPIITLLIDEATAVNKAIASKHVEMVAEMAQEGQGSMVVDCMRSEQQRSRQ